MFKVGDTIRFESTFSRNQKATFSSNRRIVAFFSGTHEIKHIEGYSGSDIDNTYAIADIPCSAGLASTSDGCYRVYFKHIVLADKNGKAICNCSWGPCLSKRRK